MTSEDIVLRMVAQLRKQIDKQRGHRNEAVIDLDQIAKALKITLEETNKHISDAIDKIGCEIAERANGTIVIRGKSRTSQRWTPLNE